MKKILFLFLIIPFVVSCGMSDEECSITDAITNHIREDEGMPYVVFQTKIVSNNENKDGTSTIIADFKLSEHHASGRIFSDCWATITKKGETYTVKDYGFGSR